jgi:hypothetical protein
MGDDDGNDDGDEEAALTKMGILASATGMECRLLSIHNGGFNIRHESCMTTTFDSSTQAQAFSNGRNPYIGPDSRLTETIEVENVKAFENLGRTVSYSDSDWLSVKKYPHLQRHAIVLLASLPSWYWRVKLSVMVDNSHTCYAHA